MRKPRACRHRFFRWIAVGSLLLAGGIGFSHRRAWSAEAGVGETVQAAGAPFREESDWQVTVPGPSVEAPTEEYSGAHAAAFSGWDAAARTTEPSPADQAKKIKAASAKAAKSHKTLFYDNDFSYLCDPYYCDWHLGDALKRNSLGSWICYDIGGQFRLRQQSERNHRGLGLTGGDDDFLLYRTRLYANVQFGRNIRVFAEMIDAVSNYETFPPRPIEENRADMLNLFGDARLLGNCRGDLWARIGRQELLYGAQRAVSPLDWANTRRTFEGYKLFWKGEKWDADAFYVRPVDVAAESFDSANYDQEFYGLYTTYRGFEKSTVDLFYLRLDDQAADFDYDTLGARWIGGEGPWSYEMWCALQLGQTRGLNHSAGAWTVGLGRKFECLPWSPAVWVYYDWASGSDDLGNGYHHLFPLSHKYLGFMDLFGRRNIETPNVQLSLQPCEKVKVLLWYYVFFLENPNDVPYTVTMRPFNPGNAPASAYLGQELDLTANWQITPRTSLLFGYSHFFAGDYYHETAGVPHRGDADFFYTQFTVNF